MSMKHCKTVYVGAIGAAELLSARAMALMLCLAEYEAAPFLDTAYGQATTKGLLDGCVQRIVGYAGQHPCSRFVSSNTDTSNAAMLTSAQPH